MSVVLLGAIKRMTYASEIINHVAKKARRRLILVIILTVALIMSNIAWAHAYAHKNTQTTVYMSQTDPIIQAQNIKRKGVPRKVSGYEKM